MLCLFFKLLGVEGTENSSNRSADIRLKWKNNKENLQNHFFHLYRDFSFVFNILPAGKRWSACRNTGFFFHHFDQTEVF